MVNFRHPCCIVVIRNDYFLHPGRIPAHPPGPSDRSGFDPGDSRSQTALVRDQHGQTSNPNSLSGSSLEDVQERSGKTFPKKSVDFRILATGV